MPSRTRFPRLVLLFTLLTALCVGTFSPRPQVVEAKPLRANALDVIISEVAWGGTAANAADEWIELYNTTGSPILLTGWTLSTADFTPNITFPSVSIPAYSFFLIECSDENTVSNISAGYIIPGTCNTNLSNAGEILTLRDSFSNIIDTANNSGGGWDAGSGAPTYNTMERVGLVADSASAWAANNGVKRNGLDAVSNPINGTAGAIKIDLSLSMSEISPALTIGGNLTFALTVNNNSTFPASNIVVKDSLPIQLTYVSDNGGGTYNSANGNWTIPSLAGGSSITLNITATLNSLLAINTAEIISFNQILDSDSIPNNNSVTEDDYASMQFSTKVSGLVITNTVNNPSPLVGSNVIFTVVASNPNSNLYPATNVSVSVPLPSGVTYISSSTTTGSYAAGNWNIGNLPIGASATLTITVKVVSSNPGVFNATLSSNEYITISDDAPFTPTPLSGQAELTITQTLDVNTGTAGQVNLVISLKNNGPDNATSVSVRDLLPSGLTYVSHSTAAGTYDSNTGIWSIGNLNNGATAELRIKVKVASSGSSTNNTAQVWTTNQFDSNPADNSSSLEVPIADLSLLQTVDITPGTAIFTITLTNSGPDDATVQIKSNLLDVSTTYAFVSAGASQGTYTQGSGIWDAGLLTDGSSATLVITTNTTGVLQSHIVEIYSSDMVDPDSIPNNKARLEDDISGLPYADLSLTQSVNNSNPNVGTNVTFTIKASNAGPVSVASLKVKDQLPTGLTYVSSSTTTGSYNSGTGIWTVGALASGASAELSITATVTTNGSFVNLTEVYESSLYDIDSIPANGANAEDDNSSITVATNTVVRSVIINEVAWAGTTSSLTGDEWIELYNTTNAAINITGWTLKAADGTPSITLNGTISAGGYFLLEREDDTTVSDILADQIYTGDLSNSGEALTLYDPSNKVIDTANGNGGSWPAGSSSTYGTMERTSTTTDSDSIWLTNTGTKRNGKNANSGDILGTPKQSNSVSSSASSSTATPEPTDTPTPPPAPIVIPPRPIINEILARPGFDWNQDGKADVFDEFIEIKNLTAADISLSGWKLDTVNGKKSFSLPDVTLKPGERVVFYSKQTNLLLSDGGETVRLSNSSGKIYDAFTYTVARAEDESFCRLPDGNPGDSWFEDCLPTPNLTNTREGQTPTSPDGNASPVCNLPDTIPVDFFIPECNGYGGRIWNPFYWDFVNWIDKLWIQQTDEKWRSYFE